jgi:hypothetical protein
VNPNSRIAAFADRGNGESPRRHAVPHSAVMERRASVRLFMALLPPEDPD